MIPLDKWVNASEVYIVTIKEAVLSFYTVMYIQVKWIIEILLSFVDWMEVDLNESLQYIVRKGAGFKQTKWLEKSCIRHQIAV